MLFGQHIQVIEILSLQHNEKTLISCTEIEHPILIV